MARLSKSSTLTLVHHLAKSYDILKFGQYLAQPLYQVRDISIKDFQKHLPESKVIPDIQNNSLFTKTITLSIFSCSMSICPIPAPVVPSEQV